MSSSQSKGRSAPIKQYADFQRYLAAKRTVDDRALNAHVWENFLSCVGGPGADTLRRQHPQPISILEIGAGIGTMIERLLDTSRLRRIDYTAIDADPDNIRVGAARLGQGRKPFAAQSKSQSGSLATSAPDIDLTYREEDWRWDVHLRCRDLFALLGHTEAYGPYDALIAHAFLDLVNSAQVLAQLGALLAPGAHLLLTINFDGATIFQPTIDADYDRLIESLYHATMDQRVVDGQPSGDSQTGRHLFHQLRAGGYTVLAAGSSDWLVAPFGGLYSADEAYFLHFIVDTVYGALAGHPQLEATRFRRWIQQRHAQIEDNELVYIAHQIDYLARNVDA